MKYRKLFHFYRKMSDNNFEIELMKLKKSVEQLTIMVKNMEKRITKLNGAVYYNVTCETVPNPPEIIKTFDPFSPYSHGKDFMARNIKRKTIETVPMARRNDESIDNRMGGVFNL